MSSRGTCTKGMTKVKVSLNQERDFVPAPWRQIVTLEMIPEKKEN